MNGSNGSGSSRRWVGRSVGGLWNRGQYSHAEGDGVKGEFQAADRAAIEATRIRHVAVMLNRALAGGTFPGHGVPVFVATVEAARLSQAQQQDSRGHANERIWREAIMSEKDSWSPFKPALPHVSQPGEGLYEIEVDGSLYRCELRDWAELGVESQDSENVMALSSPHSEQCTVTVRRSGPMSMPFTASRCARQKIPAMAPQVRCLK